MVSVAVVGAGINGLSTALCAILEGALDPSQLTIIAEKRYIDTTSYIAAGFFQAEEDLAPDLETAERWYSGTLSHYEKLHANVDPKVSGIKQISGYQLNYYEDESHCRLLKVLFPDVRQLSSEELSQLGVPSCYTFGLFYTTFIADPQKYLKYLENELQRRGVEILERRIESFDELFEQGKGFDIVVNCTGYASKKLASDHRMIPVRGQVVKVRNDPPVEHFYDAEEWYILPGVDWVTLGGTRTFKDSNLEVSQRDKQHILEGCRRLLPSLEANEEICDLVGIRPYRSPLRIEAVPRTVKGRVDSGWIVHNYGHGGQGVNLSWGTAVETVNLIKGCLEKLMQQLNADAGKKTTKPA